VVENYGADMLRMNEGRLIASCTIFLITYAAVGADISGDVVHVNVRGGSQDVPVRLLRSCVTMDATYVTMTSQKLVTIANRSDVIARYRWTRFATPEDERQHRARFQKQR